MFLQVYNLCPLFAVSAVEKLFIELLCVLYKLPVLLVNMNRYGW